MKGKRYSLSIRVDEELGQKIDALAKKYFDSNRTSLITKAIEELVNLYAGGGTFQSPSTIHAKAQANYLKEVVLQSSVPDIGILRKEIKKLWELLA